MTSKDYFCFYFVYVLIPPDTSPITDISEQYEGIRFSVPAGVINTNIPAYTMPTTFDDYKKTLPEWVQNLINGAKESIAENHIPLHELICTNRFLYFVTDGGATEGHGYFGWVIATHTKILWQGKGKVHGNPHLMESLRTESVSMLAMLLFLLHNCEFHNIATINNNLCHYCDNSRL